HIQQTNVRESRVGQTWEPETGCHRGREIRSTISQSRLVRQIRGQVVNQCVREQPLLNRSGFVEYWQSCQANTVVVGLVPSGVMMCIRTLRKVDIQNEIVLLVELWLGCQLNCSDWKLKCVGC